MEKKFQFFLREILKVDENAIIDHLEELAGRIEVTFEDDDIYPKLANPKLVKIEIIPFREDGHLSPF